MDGGIESFSALRLARTSGTAPLNPPRRFPNVPNVPNVPNIPNAPDVPNAANVPNVPTNVTWRSNESPNQLQSVEISVEMNDAAREKIQSRKISPGEKTRHGDNRFIQKLICI